MDRIQLLAEDEEAAISMANNTISAKVKRFKKQMCSQLAKLKRPLKSIDQALEEAGKELEASHGFYNVGLYNILKEKKARRRMKN